jgi:hypothetical protein
MHYNWTTTARLWWAVRKMVTIIVVMWTTSQDYDQQSFTNDLPSKIYPITMSDDFHSWVVETEHWSSSIHHQVYAQDIIYLNTLTCPWIVNVIDLFALYLVKPAPLQFDRRMTMWHNEQKYHNDLQTLDEAVATFQVWCAYMQARIYRGCLLGVDMVKMIAIL